MLYSLLLLLTVTLLLIKVTNLASVYCTQCHADSVHVEIPATTNCTDCDFAADNSTP
jgi:cation transporter-like permease